jgi:hypothetical protein
MFLPYLKEGAHYMGSCSNKAANEGMNLCVWSGNKYWNIIAETDC